MTRPRALESGVQTPVQASLFLPVTVTEWSKALVCGSSIAGIAGSNPAGGMDVCVVL